MKLFIKLVLTLFPYYNMMHTHLASTYITMAALLGETMQFPQVQ